LAASDDSPEKTNPMTGGPFTHEDENGRAPCVQVQAQAGQLSVFSYQLSVFSYQLLAFGRLGATAMKFLLVATLMIRRNSL
jgi:hypothetical protein